jgi:hypothetical protein
MTRAFQWSAIDVGISLVLLFAMYSWTRTQVVTRVPIGRG